MNKLNDELRIQSRIDSICDGFALGLRDSPHSESKLSIENLLTKHPDLPRTELLRQLLLEENDYRSSLGRPLTKASLLDRFPGDAVLIEQIFTDQTPPRTPDGTTTAPGDIKVLHPPEPPVTRSFSERVPEIRGFEFYTRKEAGTFGLVYHAFDRERRREVAIKVLKDSVAASPRERERFKLEIQALSRLRHPGIVQIHDSGTQPELCYYVMDYIESGNLAQKIADANEILTRKKNSQTATRPNAAGDTNEPGLPPAGSSPSGRSDTPSGRRPSAVTAYPDNDFLNSFGRNFGPAGNRSATAAVVEIGIQVADAMHYVHENRIVHRDLKPNNLLVDSAGRVYVADFGLAQYEQVNLTLTNQDIGTLAYMAPEQLQGNRLLIDARSDIFSLGATLYELLALTRLRDGETGEARRRQALFETPVPLRRRNSAVSKDLETIIHRAVAFRPDDRYATMQELADDLRRFQRREPIHAKPAGPLKRFSLWVEREQKLAASLAASAALLLVILGLLLVVFYDKNLHTAAEVQRQIAENNLVAAQLKESESGRLVMSSLLLSSKNEDPALALLLAAESAKLTQNRDSNAAMILALRNNHELRSIDCLDCREKFGGFRVHPDGNRLVTYASPDQFRPDRNSPALEFDIKSGLTLHSHGTGGTVINALWTPSGRQLVTFEAKCLKHDPQKAKISLYVQTSQQSKTLLHTFDLPTDFLRTFSQAWPAEIPNTNDSAIVFSDGHSLLLSNLGGTSSTTQVKKILFDGHLTNLQQINSNILHPKGLIVAIDSTGSFHVIDLQSFRRIDQFHLPSLVQPGKPVQIAETKNGSLLIASTRGSCIVDVQGKPLTSTWPQNHFHLEPGGSHALFYGATTGVTRRNLVSAIDTHIICPQLPVKSAICLADSETIVVSSPYDELLAFSLTSTLPGKALSHHRTPLISLVPIDNLRFVTLSLTGRISVLSAKTTAQLRSVPDGITNTVSVPPVFSDDGTLLTATLRPTELTERLRPLSPDENNIRLRHRGRLSHRRSHDSTAIFSDARSLAIINKNDPDEDPRQFNLPFEIQRSQPLTKSKMLLISATGRASIFDCRTEETLRLTDDSTSITDFDVCFRNDTALAVLCSDQGHIFVHDTATGVTNKISLKSPATCISLSRDGKVAVCADRTGTVYRLSGDITHLQQKDDTALPIQTVITSVEFSPDNTTFLVLSADTSSNVQVINSQTFEIEATNTVAGAHHALWINSEEIAVASSFGLFKWRHAEPQPATQIRKSKIRSLTGAGAILTWIEEPLEQTAASHKSQTERLRSPNTVPEQITAFSWDLNQVTPIQHQVSGQPLSVHADDDSQHVHISTRMHWQNTYSTAEMQLQSTPRSQHADQPILMRFLPNSHTICMVFADGWCDLMSLPDGELKQHRLSTTALIKATLSTQRTHILAVDADGRGHAYRLAGFSAFAVRELEANVADIQMSSDNQQLFVLYTNGDLRLIRLNPDVAASQSDLLAKDVKSIEASTTNPRLLLINSHTDDHSTPTVMDTQSHKCSLIGDSLRPLMTTFGTAGDSILMLTEDQRLLCLPLSLRDDQWIVMDNLISVLSTGVVFFSRPVDSMFAIAQKTSEMEFIPLTNAQTGFRIPLSGIATFEPLDKRLKATVSPDGKWFVMPAKTIECWPSDLKTFADVYAARKLTTAERRLYNIRVDDMP